MDITNNTNPETKLLERSHEIAEKQRNDLTEAYENVGEAFKEYQKHINSAEESILTLDDVLSDLFNEANKIDKHLENLEKISKGRDLTEMNKLEEYLKANNYLYKRTDIPGELLSRRDGSEELINDRHQIKVYRNERDMADDLQIWDVICQFGSYGCNEGLLEILGYPVDDPPWEDNEEGYLQAEDIIQLIEEEKRRKQYAGQDL